VPATDTVTRNLWGKALIARIVGGRSFFSAGTMLFLHFVRIFLYKL
jgi:hypothetical protein